MTLVGLGQLESTALKTLVGYTQLFWRINKYLSNDSQKIEINAAASVYSPLDPTNHSSAMIGCAASWTCQLDVPFGIAS